jgi:hypothetical protein
MVQLEEVFQITVVMNSSEDKSLVIPSLLWLSRGVLSKSATMNMSSLASCFASWNGVRSFRIWLHGYASFF